MNYVERVLTIVALIAASYWLSSFPAMSLVSPDILGLLIFVSLVWAYLMGIISGKRD